MNLCDTKDREAGKLKHLCHVKEGWGLNWEGSLDWCCWEGGQMACHSWNNASFQYILFCHVLKKEKKDSGAILLFFWDFMVSGEDIIFFYFFFKNCRKWENAGN